MKSAYFKYGDGKYAVEAKAEPAGPDMTIRITGGTAPHVGAVALAQYEPERKSATVNALAAYTHRDDYAASMFAKEASRRFGCNAAATAGIHIDGASAEELNMLRNNIQKCCEGLMRALED